MRGVRGGAIVCAVLIAAASLPASAYPRPGHTERVSVASDGTQGNDFSSPAAISADGRHVAFRSRASSLVPGDTNSTWDVFVHDRQTGVTERVSVASDGTEGNSSSLGFPAISGDGRHVAFESDASNLVAGDTNSTWDVFVHDRQTGTTERVSVASDGTEANTWLLNPTRPAISADGRHVAFESIASNLVPDDTNDHCGFTGNLNCRDVFVHDRQAGTTERVSVASDGTEGNGDSFGPAISGDGRHVAFSSFASNLVPDDTNDTRDVFVHDRQTGVTERVSVASDGAEGDFQSLEPTISADGRSVAFRSHAANLVPNDTNATADIFVHDRETRTTERLSVTTVATEGNGISANPAISADGRHVAFESSASNLVPEDENSAWDLFIHDRETGVTERVSAASDGADGNGNSWIAAVNADGRHVAFTSFASNLVPNDTNGAADVLVRDRGPATGVGALGVQNVSGELAVSGWATFSGAIVASADDPADDGRVGARELGAEIVGASVTYRPEEEDVLLRLQLAHLLEGGAPGVLYRWAFTAEQTAYEARALRAAATTDPPTTEPYFALYRCDVVCTETARLSGGIGATGDEVRVSVPLEALGVEEGTALTAVEASAALGEASPGPLVALDEVALPDASIPVSRVELGVAPSSAPQADVAFSAQAELVEGRFSATLDASSLPPGAHRVWARACLGETCGAEWVAVAL